MQPETDRPRTGQNYRDETAKQADQPAVHASASYIEDRVDRLVEIIDNLTPRLSPVLSPGIPAMEGGALASHPREERCGLAERLQAIGNRVDGVADNVQTILARLEI